MRRQRIEFDKLAKEDAKKKKIKKLESDKR